MKAFPLETSQVINLPAEQRFLEESPAAMV